MTRIAAAVYLIVSVVLASTAIADTPAFALHPGDEYVALGSSFAAGPGVGERARDAPRLCLQSESNYPHLLAARLHLHVIDNTCSGATARQVLEGGQYFHGAQIDALSNKTRLVTLTAGGNDIGYLRNLIAWSCGGARDKIPFLYRFAVCTPQAEAAVNQAIGALPELLRTLLETIKARAPHARIIVVNYAAAIPESGSCPGRLPMTEPQLSRARFMKKQLEVITAKAAAAGGVELLDAAAVTRGHDVCSKDPWFSGLIMPSAPWVFGPIAYHPTDQAMEQIAQALEKRLRIDEGQHTADPDSMSLKGEH